MMEFLKLLWIRIYVSVYEGAEFFKMAWQYYSNTKFRKVDLALYRSYFFESPYDISKAYLAEKGACDPYLYGETPLTTFAHIIAKCGVTKDDHFYELGAGRGRTCFWLASFVGCEVVGVEQIPTFVEIAKKLQREYKIGSLTFRQGNYLDIDFRRATVVYLYGTCLEEGEIDQLIEKLLELPDGARIISVSYPLTDYLSLTQYGQFHVVHSFDVSFPWGKAQVYLQIRTTSSSNAVSKRR